MNNTNQNEAGAIQLDGVSETLVASAELLGFEPTSFQIAKAQAFLEAFPTTTAALVTLRTAVLLLEQQSGRPGENSVSDAILASLFRIAVLEAVSL